MKENEERPLSNEVKRHFLEIVSTYNKYQESMDRKSDITQVQKHLVELPRTLQSENEVIGSINILLREI